MSQATAAVTFTGTVNFDEEQNVLGVADGYNVFTGDTVTISFNKNTANGYTNSYPGYYSDTYGGSGYGGGYGSSPVIGGTLSVGGASQAFSGAWYGEVYNASANWYGTGEQYAYASYYGYNGGQWINSSVYAEIYGPNVPEYGSFSAPNGGTFELQMSTYDTETGASQYADVYGTVTGVSSGVPELSTWAMMLAGFAGLGFLGYRKSRNEAASVAA